MRKVNLILYQFNFILYIDWTSVNTRMVSVKSTMFFFAVRVIVFCLKIIGLAPFAVRIEKPAQISPNDSPVEAFFFSKVGLAYNILLLITVIVVSAICTPIFIHKNVLSEVKIVNILSAISTAEKILFIFTSCLVIISWAFKQKKAACVMNRLLDVDVRLSGLKKRPFNKRILIFLTLHIILNLCLWITYWVGIIIHLDFGNPLTEFLVRLPPCIVYWIIMEYIVVVGLVLRDLETVNKYLLDFKQFGNYLSHPPVRHGISVESIPNHFSSQIASLKVLHSVRTTLFEVCEDTADFFSLPILFSIGSCFIPIFDKLYRVSRTTNNRSPGFTAIFTIIFVLKYIYPIVSLTLNVTRTKKEAELTGRIVHKLLAEARRDEIKAELEQFSLQLLHEEVNFTAYGMFPLDSTLLQSILGGVASYAIILTQFGSSVCNCNCNWNATSAE